MINSTDILELGYFCQIKRGILIKVPKTSLKYHFSIYRGSSQNF